MQLRMSRISDNLLWVKLAFATIIHQAGALRELMHNQLGLTSDVYTLHSWLTNFKKKQPKIVKKIFKNWSDKIFHDCKEQSCEPNNCKKKNITNIKDLDFTILAAIFENIEHIVPPNVQSTLRQHLTDILKVYKPFVDQARKDRNKVMHHPDKALNKQAFDDIWISMEENLNGMNYQNVQDFRKLGTSSLSELLQLKEDFNPIRDEEISRLLARISKIEAELKAEQSKGMWYDFYSFIFHYSHSISPGLFYFFVYLVYFLVFN